MLNKLENLGCLKLIEKNKEKMESSIVGVLNMMKTISEVDLVEKIGIEEQSTVFRNDVVKKEEVLNVNDDDKNIYLEDGLFLAPKTIRK